MKNDDLSLEEQEQLNIWNESIVMPLSDTIDTFDVPFIKEFDIPYSSGGSSRLANWGTRD